MPQKPMVMEIMVHPKPYLPAPKYFAGNPGSTQDKDTQALRFTYPKGERVPIRSSNLNYPNLPMP